MKIINILYIIILILLIISINTVNAGVSINIDTKFDDLNYTYTVNTNFATGSINVTEGEIYFSGDAFCDYINRSYLTTIRSCLEAEEEAGGGAIGGHESVICYTNEDCPYSSTCYNNHCELLICNETQILSDDGHECKEREILITSRVSSSMFFVITTIILLIYTLFFRKRKEKNGKV